MSHNLYCKELQQICNVKHSTIIAYFTQIASGIPKESGQIKDLTLQNEMR